MPPAGCRKHASARAEARWVQMHAELASEEKAAAATAAASARPQDQDDDQPAARPPCVPRAAGVPVAHLTPPAREQTAADHAPHARGRPPARGRGAQAGARGAQAAARAAGARQAEREQGLGRGTRRAHTHACTARPAQPNAHMHGCEQEKASIQAAINAIGDIKLKSAPNYVVPLHLVRRAAPCCPRLGASAD